MLHCMFIGSHAENHTCMHAHICIESFTIHHVYYAES